MARISRGVLLIGLALSLAGCFRQAEETFEPVTLESPAGTPATLPPLNLGAATATATFQLLVTVEASLTPDAASATLPFDEITATNSSSGQIFITPGSPLNTLISVTDTPTIGTPASVTPGGLITPTDFFNPDETGVNTACEYTVKGGDTLFRIAINNDTTVDAIKDANDLSGDSIFPGDILIIPGCGEEQTDPSATDDPNASATDLPDGWQIHVVASGEVLGTIAERYGVPQSAIIAANNLDNPNSLSVGQELIIPAPE